MHELFAFADGTVSHPQDEARECRAGDAKCVVRLYFVQQIKHGI